MIKCIFLDRDGVLNEEVGDYVYKVNDFQIKEGVKEALQKLKKEGYLLIVITNQAGIAKGIYTKNDVLNCHQYLQEYCGHIIDDIYFSPHHEDFDTASLLKKPNSLMLEKAIAKYNINSANSWMIGDQQRDLIAGKKAGLRTIYISDTKKTEALAEATFSSLLEAASYIY